MIQIEKIEISNFRGIRDLILEPKRNSFGIFGPNGTGKSSVVDAVEFALTGGIRRFEGRGKGNVTVTKHASHIDSGDKKNSKVTLQVYLPGIDKSATITRYAKNKRVKIEPSDSEVQALLKEAEEHPEVALSRREVANLIVIEAGGRASAILKLLRLNNLEKTRERLRKAWIRAKACSLEHRRAFHDLEQVLANCFDIEEPSKQATLDAINERRATLGLSQYNNLEEISSLLDGLDGVDRSSTTISKALTNANLKQFVSSLDRLVDSPALFQLNEHWEEYDNGAVRDETRLRELTQLGRELILDDHCPLCESKLDQNELKTRLNSRLDCLSGSLKLENKMLAWIQDCVAQAKELAGDLQMLIRATKKLGLESIQTFLETMANSIESMQQHQFSTECASKNREVFRKQTLQMNGELDRVVAELRTAIEQMPEQSETEKIKYDLRYANDNFWNYLGAKSKFEEAKAVEELAEQVLQSYRDSVETVLDGLFRQVESDFAQFYAAINSEDEAGFIVHFEHEAKRVDLSVDFYQRGLHPASAYHSEGHQDSMGLCLYLALMKQLLKSEFQLVLLDDVIMSVDKAHRRKLCSVLKENFPNTQFIITTHDRTWFEQMNKAKLIHRKSSVRFLDWSLECGPVVESARTDWEEIDRALEDGDIPGAAHRLRRYLEATSTELADILGAKVVYRADNDYHLGELFEGVCARFDKLIGKASKSAQEWGKKAEFNKLQVLRGRLKKCLESIKEYDWMINKAVHFNDWADFSRTDFMPAATAFKEIFQLFKCDNLRCNSWLKVTKDGYEDESLKCDCNLINFNLRSPSREQKED